jgi:hypothetical protein
MDPRTCLNRITALQQKVTMAGKRLTWTLGADTRQSDVKIDEAKAKLRSLTDKVYNAKIGLNDTELQVKAKEAALVLDRLDRKKISPNMSTSRIDAFSLAVDKAGLKVEKLGRESIGMAERDITSLGADLGALSNYALPAAVAGLVALTGQAAVVATGLGGLGLAAISVVKNQALMAKTLAPLKAEYASFSKELQPDVLGVFNQGVGLAGHLLADIKPVAHSAGEALTSVLGSVDKEFASGTWQSFFGFMQREAGPDVQQLGRVLTDLLGIVPPLAEAFHPLGNAIINDADDIIKLTGAVAKLETGFENLGHGHGAVQDFIGSHLKGAAENAFNALVPGAKLQDSLNKAADASNRAAAKQHGLVSAERSVQEAAAAEARQMNSLASSLDKLTNKTLTLQGDQVSWRQSIHDATKAINDNHNALDGNTQSALAARQAIIQSSSAAIKFAQDQVQQKHDVAGATQTIESQIRFLEQHAGKSRVAQQEINALRQAELALPHSIRTRLILNAGAAEEAERQYLRFLASIPRSVTTTVYSNTVRHKFGYAEGTKGALPGWSWVGERGPELVKFKGGERVLPFAESMRAVSRGYADGTESGSSTVIHNHFNVNTPRGNEAEAGRIIVEQIRQYESRSGKGWRS